MVLIGNKYRLQKYDALNWISVYKKKKKNQYIVETCTSLNHCTIISHRIERVSCLWKTRDLFSYDLYNIIIWRTTCN